MRFVARLDFTMWLDTPSDSMLIQLLHQHTMETQHHGNYRMATQSRRYMLSTTSWSNTLAVEENRLTQAIHCQR